MSAISFSAMRAIRAPTSRRFLPRTTLRYYAAKKDMSAGQPGETPQASSNVVAPQSASAEEQGVNRSRGLDSKSSPDTASVQQPASDLKGSATGMQEENTSTQDTFKQDPNKPASEKRQNVEEKGQRPLDAGDK